MEKITRLLCQGFVSCDSCILLYSDRLILKAIFHENHQPWRSFVSPRFTLSFAKYSLPAVDIGYSTFEHELSLHSPSNRTFVFVFAFRYILCSVPARFSYVCHSCDCIIYRHALEFRTVSDPRLSPYFVLKALITY